MDAGQPVPGAIVALLDARMGEIYVAPYRCAAAGPAGLTPLAPPRLCTPADLPAYLQELAPGERLLAGNVFDMEPLAALEGRGVLRVEYRTLRFLDAQKLRDSAAAL